MRYCGAPGDGLPTAPPTSYDRVTHLPSAAGKSIWRTAVFEQIKVKICINERLRHEVALDKRDIRGVTATMAGHADHARVAVDAGYPAAAGRQAKCQPAVGAAHVQRVIAAAAGRPG
jgi:hypothetical protein